MDAAGLESKENIEVVVESIQINEPTNISQDHTSDLSKGKDLNFASSNTSSAVSTLLVSERTCSGTESVQISEKLISREN